MNKRGMELSMNFIIIAALALIVLIVGAIFFMGGFENITSEAEEIVGVSTQELALAESACKAACATNAESQWNEPSFPEAVSEKFADCEELMVSYLGQSYIWENGVCNSE